MRYDQLSAGRSNGDSHPSDDRVVRNLVKRALVGVAGGLVTIWEVISSNSMRVVEGGGPINPALSGTIPEYCLGWWVRGQSPGPGWVSKKLAPRVTSL
ncbi:hypothetical protein ACLOJK_028158 [Asimina triloba]